MSSTPRQRQQCGVLPALGHGTARAESPPRRNSARYPAHEGMWLARRGPREGVTGAGAAGPRSTERAASVGSRAPTWCGAARQGCAARLCGSGHNGYAPDLGWPARWPALRHGARQQTRAARQDTFVERAASRTSGAPTSRLARAGRVGRWRVLRAQHGRRGPLTGNEPRQPWHCCSCNDLI